MNHEPQPSFDPSADDSLDPNAARGQPSLAVIGLETHPLDPWLLDPDSSSDEISAVARPYLQTPRAWIWHQPTSDWRLLVLMPPVASRMGLLRIPIFGQLVRQWGSHLTALGIDSDRQIRSFAPLLSDDLLSKLMLQLLRSPPSRGASIDEAASHAVLDLLFEGACRNASQAPETRGHNGEGAPDLEGFVSPLSVPLAYQGVLASGHDRSLFVRQARNAELLSVLREALKRGQLKESFYVRLLASIQSREALWEQRLAHHVIRTLNSRVVQTLQQQRFGLNLGLYNWLVSDPLHAAHRLNAATRLPALIEYFAAGIARDALDPALVENAHWVTQAIDSGQDRALISALSHRFSVQENTLRHLWRLAPPALDALSIWQLQTVLLRLDDQPVRHWPAGDAAWQEWLTHCVPLSAL